MHNGQSGLKKRPAKTQGPKDTKKRKTAAEGHDNPRQVKKRNRPITLLDDAKSSSDEEEHEEDENEYQSQEDAMHIDNDPKIKSDKNSAESHKAKKELLSQRKAAKPNAAMMERAKSIWALARKRDIPKPEREKHIQDLTKVVTGKVQEVVFKHDGSRIIQTIVKFGKQEQRNIVASELKGRFKELAQDKYSKFLVIKLIRYCPTHRTSILGEFRGNVIRLLLHREAGRVISDAFELYADSADKSLLLREFYGKEVMLFEPRKEGKTTLQDILEGLDQEHRKRIRNALKVNIQQIFNNSDKGAVSNAIVHRALWEYLSEIETLEDKAETELLRREVYELCQDVVAELVHTKNGSQSVRHFLAYGTAKDRKQIIKVLKPHLEKLCLDDEAQLVLFTILDVVDDTKMLAKSLLGDLAALTPKLYTDGNGRRALLYPLINRSTRHFTPAIVSALSLTDPIKATTSKKDDDVRRKEIVEAISPDMLDQIKSHARSMIVDPGGSLLVAEVLLHAQGDPDAAIEAVLKPLCADYPAEGGIHPIDHAHTSRMLKVLLQGGHWSRSENSVTRSPNYNAAKFASSFIRLVGDDEKERGKRIVAMAQGNGTFVIAELTERTRVEGGPEEKKLLKKWFSKDLIQKMESSDIRGKEVLLEALSKLRN